MGQDFDPLIVALGRTVCCLCFIYVFKVIFVLRGRKIVLLHTCIHARSFLNLNTIKYRDNECSIQRKPVLQVENEWKILQQIDNFTQQ